MATQSDEKLKRLMSTLRPGAVCLPGWLEGKGISRDLQQYYVRSGWLVSIGRGAYARPGSSVEWQDGLEALQQQAELDIHVGGATALAEAGYEHYLSLGEERVQLFSPPRVSLPAWFVRANWQAHVVHTRTDFLVGHVGVSDLGSTIHTLKQSAPERGMLECLYLTPKKMGLIECFQLMEGLVNLRPHVVQALLEGCSSVKVKRLFLYMASKACHQWLQYVALDKVDLGRGDRSISTGGAYIKEFQISVPRELAAL